MERIKVRSVRKMLTWVMSLQMDPMELGGLVLRAFCLLRFVAKNESRKQDMVIYYSLLLNK